MSSPLPVIVGPGKDPVEPKKSARLAEKRKLREEAGPPVIEEDYYFTPLTRINRGSTSNSATVSPVPGAASRLASVVSPVLVKERLTPSPSFRNQVRASAPIQGSTPTTLVVGVPEQTVPPLATTVKVDIQTRVASCSGGGEESRIPEYEISTHTALSKSPPLEGGTVKDLDASSQKILYINGAESITLSFPLGMDYPLPSKSSLPPHPPVTFCIIPECPNRKKYSCSTTKAPLCSLGCYNKNLASAGSATSPPNSVQIKST